MAPCELRQEFAAASARQKDEAGRDLILAWNVVRIYVLTQNKKQLPALADLLGELTGEKKAADTPKQHRAALHVLAAQYGIPLRPHRKATSTKERTPKPVRKKRNSKRRPIG